MHAPGFYLHLEPGNLFAGAGIWHPDGSALQMIRNAIVDDPGAWQRAVSSKTFRSTYELAGDSLSRAPKGFDAGHPLIEDLRRKDFVAMTKLSEKGVLSSDFLTRYTRVARAATPLMKFLTRALEVAW